MTCTLDLLRDSGNWSFTQGMICAIHGRFCSRASRANPNPAGSFCKHQFFGAGDAQNLRRRLSS